MGTEADKLKSRAKQRKQQIARMQIAGRGGIVQLEDLGSPAEDDDVDAVTRFAHEVRRAERRAKEGLRVARGTRPR